MQWLWIAFVSSMCAACGGSSPPSSPVVNPPEGNEPINGTERIGWDQPASDARELAKIHYLVYVDSTRTELTGVSCTPTAAATGFACTASLPPMTIGAHTLQLASFVNDGSAHESARSAPLHVTVVAHITTGAATMQAGATRPGDGVAARVEIVATGVEAPTDLAFAPDGRLFITERGGRIRIVRNGRLLAQPAIVLDRTLGAGGQLLSLALDPQFARTQLVYILYTAPARSGGSMFSIARLREAADTLGDRVVLLDDVPASASPAAALRFGPDGKLYAALDSAGDAHRSDDRGSLNGKVLRLNTDGTTPSDQAGSTPIFATGLVAPVGLAWHPASGALWVADRGSAPPQLRPIVAQNSAPSSTDGKRGGAREAYALPAGTTPSALASGGGDLFSDRASGLLVASERGAHLLRVRLDPQTAKPGGIETLLHGQVDVVRAVTIASDGAIYFATSNSVGRIVRDDR